ncbi:hypothetical protein FE257_002766 [Aspergillus nanangensis]|uniref:Uncharacterized protein n=1 Tax=Aspergillus nanangensis TaxID=2582783 RepID=A0AAD4GN65_ASPNN|nr:hypothetical protein FE257_002766 [Aspergillus nanangensis]
MFQGLKTNTILRLDPSNFFPTSHRESIERWGDDIQRYAREHQNTVSIFKNRLHEFPNSLKDMIIDQAVPSAVHGKFVLLLTIGAGISREGYREEQPFFEGHSASSVLLKTFLDRLWSWEQSKYPGFGHVNRFVSIGALPFVDLCPWYEAKGEDLVAAASFLKQYIVLVRPLVMLTLAEKPSSIVASEFSFTSENPSFGFWSQVGHLQLTDVEGQYHIQLPCFHPGQARFFIDPIVFFTVLDMTLWVLLLTISVSLDSLALSRTESREDWCKYIKSVVDSILNKQDFYSGYEKLKETLHHCRSKKSNISTHAQQEHYRVVVASRKDVDQQIYSGFAIDRPMSDRRRQQAYRLWELNIPELHLHVGRHTRHDWLQWILSVEEGVSLFADSISNAVWSSISGSRNIQTLQDLRDIASESRVADICVKNKLIHNIQNILANDLLLNTEWTTYYDLVAAVTTELSHDLPLWKWMHASTISDGLSKTGIARFKPLYLVDLNGSEVYVWQNCSFEIYWQSPSGQRYKFTMRAPQSSQDKSYTERKWVFFTKDGIDLRDGKGVSCLTHKGALNSSNIVTFPVQHLPNCQATAELGQKLVKLWESETGLEWDKLIARSSLKFQACEHEDDIDCLAKSFFAGEGLELIRSNWNAGKLKPYESCPSPADETWLLWTCLKKYWPNGGTLFIGIPEKWPSRRDNIWIRFRE